MGFEGQAAMKSDGCQNEGSSSSTFDRMTRGDGLHALRSSKQGERELKQRFDILYFNLFFCGRHSSLSVYPPAFWRISSVISLAL